LYSANSSGYVLQVTVAAANINFDFTLVKYEAPKEYQPLGGVLSLRRKRDAESGTAHTTAQRLGALFEGACPTTPHLIAAYGKRVSEIAEAATKTDLKELSKSMFVTYSGVDATSIWAAATRQKWHSQFTCQAVCWHVLLKHQKLFQSRWIWCMNNVGILPIVWKGVIVYHSRSLPLQYSKRSAEPAWQNGTPAHVLGFEPQIVSSGNSKPS
jgi:hypothetical protein